MPYLTDRFVHELNDYALRFKLNSTRPPWLYVILTVKMHHLETKIHISVRSNRKL